LYTQFESETEINFAVRAEKNHFTKNKTHQKFEKFDLKTSFLYKHQCHEGYGQRDQQRDGERSREALGESKGRAVCTCYDALG